MGVFETVKEGVDATIVVLKFFAVLVSNNFLIGKHFRSRLLHTIEDEITRVIEYI